MGVSSTATRETPGQVKLRFAHFKEGDLPPLPGSFIPMAEKPQSP